MNTWRYKIVVQPSSYTWSWHQCCSPPDNLLVHHFPEAKELCSEDELSFMSMKGRWMSLCKSPLGCNSSAGKDVRKELRSGSRGKCCRTTDRIPSFRVSWTWKGMFLLFQRVSSRFLWNEPICVQGSFQWLDCWEYSSQFEGWYQAFKAWELALTHLWLIFLFFSWGLYSWLLLRFPCFSSQLFCNILANRWTKISESVIWQFQIFLLKVIWAYFRPYSHQ